VVVNSGAEEVEGSENRPDWATDDTPFDKPSAARMYDYYLGAIITSRLTAEWLSEPSRSGLIFR